MGQCSVPTRSVGQFSVGQFSVGQSSGIRRFAFIKKFSYIYVGLKEEFEALNFTLKHKFHQADYHATSEEIP